MPVNYNNIIKISEIIEDHLEIGSTSEKDKKRRLKKIRAAIRECMEKDLLAVIN